MSFNPWVKDTDLERRVPFRGIVSISDEQRSFRSTSEAYVVIVLSDA